MPACPSSLPPLPPNFLSVGGAGQAPREAGSQLEINVQEFLREYGREGKGREGIRTGQMEMDYDAASKEAVLSPTGSSEAGMAFQRCPKLGQEGDLYRSKLDHLE